ncbi:MAG: hypothetical protein J9259_09380 [Thermoplasmata archaeon YP2-bin.285]|uniref:Uncharacterized protein n=1 Tax=Candidatus Sysuiplasma superficiale TaxID=2823368 RepID=A0A8J7YPW3_9ARCH|nr:hypothetical protein [Candidatus Sysuiplasma superficiale]
MERKFTTKLCALVVVALFVIVSGAALIGTLQKSGPVYGSIKLPFQSNPWTTELNVSISRVAYITQPPQWQFSASNHSVKQAYKDSTAWVTNNSGYQFFVWNSTTSTAPSPASLNFNVSSYIGSSVKYMFLASRFAVNGTGATAYIEMSESSQTAAPAGAADNALNSAATAANNVIIIALTEHNASTYVPTVDYYAENSKGYQNYTTYTFGTNISSLQFYDFMINAQPGGTVVSIMNGTGSVVDTSSTLYPVLDGNLTKVAYASYVIVAAASTAGDMGILNYAYLVDHNSIVYSSSVATAGVASALTESIAPFDPGASQGNFTQQPNATNSYSSTAISSSDFTSIVNSSSNASRQSSLINPAYLPAANQTEVLPTQALTSMRTNSSVPSTVTANLYLTSWTQKSINASIMSFLQGYIGSRISVPANDVFIISYLVDAKSFNTNFSSATMKQVGDYIYNAAPGILQSNHLSLVDVQSGAIAAGAAIGDFWTPHGPVAPEIISPGMMLNPYTGAVYSSAIAAGFPAGSYIGAASVVVPGQAPFYGFAADGAPIFGASFNPFGLSGAASAVGSFLQSGAKAISNAVKPVSSLPTDIYTIKQSAGSAIGSDLTSFAHDMSQATNSVMPFLGGVEGQVSTSVGGTISHTLSGVSNGLASFRSGAAGAIAAGVSDIHQQVFSIGATVSHLGANATHGLYTTAKSFVSDANAVISPIVTSVKNIPGALNSTAQVIGKTVLAAGQSMFSSASKLGSQILTEGQNALDTVGNGFVKLTNGSLQWEANAFGAIGHALSSPFTFFGSMSSSITHILLYVAIGGVVIVIIIVGLYVFTHDGKSKGRRKSSSKSRRR